MTYLLLHVVERIRRVDSEANQDDVRIRVRERAKTVVILLTSRIPESELDMLAVHLDIGDVILEDGGNIDLSREISICFVCS